MSKPDRMLAAKFRGDGCARKGSSGGLAGSGPPAGFIGEFERACAVEAPHDAAVFNLAANSPPRQTQTEGCGRPRVFIARGVRTRGKTWAPGGGDRSARARDSARELRLSVGADMSRLSPAGDASHCPDQSECVIDRGVNVARGDRIADPVELIDALGVSFDRLRPLRDERGV